MTLAFDSKRIMTVTDVVADETGLRIAKGQQSGNDQLPPGVADHHERRPHGAEHRQVGDHLNAVVAVARAEQTGVSYLAEQAGERFVTYGAGRLFAAH